MLYQHVGLYRAKLEAILPSVYAPFGFEHPAAAVTNHTDLLPATKGMPRGKIVYARAWGRPVAPGASWCGHRRTPIRRPLDFLKREGGSLPVALASCSTHGGSIQFVRCPAYTSSERGRPEGCDTTHV